MIFFLLQLLNLLKIVIHKQRSKSTGGEAHMKFDPKSALFVCNRFDLVDKGELDKVKQNALGNYNNYLFYNINQTNFKIYIFDDERTHQVLVWLPYMTLRVAGLAFRLTGWSQDKWTSSTCNLPRKMPYITLKMLKAA